jgi:hypothetical protein
MSEQPRTVDDLDPDQQVWLPESARYGSRAHLDADCPRLHNGSKSRTVRVLHPSREICKHCDPAYQLPRRGGSSPAWDLRKQHDGGDE